MKTLILAAIRCSLLFFVPSVTYAISAQWDLDPISGDWNTAENWTPNEVPNGPADVATFGLSNTTHVSISANTQVNSITFTPTATNPYSFTVADGVTLTISGLGIVNNSGNNFHEFLTASSGQIRFTHSSTAGDVFTEFLSCTTNFFDRSTAGSSFLDAGTTNFFDRSTAGNSLTSGFATTNFFDRSTAGNSSIEPVGGRINFFDHSSAGSAQIGGFFGGQISFFDHSTAGNATINVSSFEKDAICSFADSSNAGSATIMLNPFTDTVAVFFVDSSEGGTAQIKFSPFLGSDQRLDISAHAAPGVTIGSIEGNGNVFLGANNLTVGSNNLSTTFGGVIQDGGQGGGSGGSLTKIGTGTFILSGANTYTGDTNINRGVLQVDGSITSNTFVNRAGTLAGIGTINANLTNNGKVIPGSAGAPGMLTVTGNYTQAQYAALMIELAGTNAGEFSVLNVLGTANLGGRLQPDLLNGFLPTVGESFTFLQYGAVNGTLFMFNRNIDNLPEHWEVSYLPTSAILTVVAGNVPVPDQGSTFLLLALGLLGLVTYRPQMTRKQS